MKPQPFQVSDGADQRRFRSGADSHTTPFDAVGWQPCCGRSGQGDGAEVSAEGSAAAEGGKVSL